ncbi:phiSA1p31-related protein [Streptomyces stramineus]|uniref:Immunity protein 35 domain-containing protein n=1 Tax=Streptomyces stramineus TaxID=173861 RepID=A0ABP3JHG7_9ACTN
MSILDDLTAAASTPGLPVGDQQQLARAIGDIHEIDGVPFDLSCLLVDATGGRWSWTGQRDDQGVPLMRFVPRPGDGQDMTAAERTPLPLNDLWWHHGPLLREQPPLLARDYRHALRTAPTPLDVFGGAA